MAKIQITPSKVYITLTEDQLKKINAKKRDIVFVAKPYHEPIDQEAMSQRTELEIANTPKDEFINRWSDYWETIHRKYVAKEGTEGALNTK